MPRQPKQPWTQEEDDVLKRFMRENRKYSWAEIIKQGNLKGKTPKSCSHRWHNFLKSDFKGGKFSTKEDEQIINLKRRGKSWASMAEDRLLEQRSPLAIKNRWYNNLKRTATVSDPRRPLPNHVQQPLMNDQTTDHSLSEDIIARTSFLFIDDDIEPSFPEDRIEAYNSFLLSTTDDHQNPIGSIPQHSHSWSEDDTEAWVSSVIIEDDQNPISSIPEHSS